MHDVTSTPPPNTIHMIITEVLISGKLTVLQRELLSHCCSSPCPVHTNRARALQNIGSLAVDKGKYRLCGCFGKRREMGWRPLSIFRDDTWAGFPLPWLIRPLLEMVLRYCKGKFMAGRGCWKAWLDGTYFVSRMYSFSWEVFDFSVWIFKGCQVSTTYIRYPAWSSPILLPSSALRCSPLHLLSLYPMSRARPRQHLRREILCRIS